MLDFQKRFAQEYDYLVALRRDFHQHPEKSLCEFRTAQRIEEELEKMNIPHQRMGETGVLGILSGEKTSCGAIILRTDIDALPIEETNKIPYCSQNKGVMHACGHDAHTACLLGAAHVLSQHREAFGGEIRFVFQPAEEIGQGTQPFLEAGVHHGVKRVFGIHTAPDLPAGSVGIKPGLNNAAVDHFAIVIHGRSAHVSTPQLGVDALYIASQVVVALQAIVTRRTAPIDPVIIGIGTFHAGTTYNALAASAVLEGTTRTISLAMQEQIRSQVTQIVKQTAELYGGEAEITWTTFTPPLINDLQASQEAMAMTRSIWGDDVIRTDRPLSLGGDNFADFLQEIPGVYAYLGSGNSKLPETLNSAHNGNFNIDEAILPFGAGLYVAYALYQLNEKTNE